MTAPTNRGRPPTCKRPPPGDGDLYGLADRYVSERVGMGRLAKTTGRNVRNVLYGLADTFTGRDPGDLTADDIARWISGHGWKPATVHTVIGKLRPFLAWAAERGELPAGLDARLHLPRLPRAVPRALQPARVAQLLEVAPDARGRLIVLAMAQEGLRRGEVTRLRLVDIDPAERTWRVWGKGSKERILPVSDETWTALEGWLVERGPTPGALISNYDRPGEALTPTWVGALVSRWMGAAGLKAGPGDGVSGHALRHTAATEMLRGGANIRAVQAALGHSTLEMTERYLTLHPGDLRQAMAGRTYGPGPVEPAGEPVPALDALGPLIDTVAALAAAIARLETRLGVLPPAPGLQPDAPVATRPIGRTPSPRPAEWDRPPTPVACNAARWTTVKHEHNSAGGCICPCGQTFTAIYSGLPAAAHLNSPHDRCPECGRLTTRLHQHRVRFHGHPPGPIPAPPDCPWVTPHDHTGAGHCICPWCRQTSAGIGHLGRGPEAMAVHVTRRHTKCPDCDRSFIDLAAHRRRTHPWADPASKEESHG